MDNRIFVTDQPKELTPDEASALLTSGEETGEYVPLGMFYVKEGDRYTGIDNSYGDAWTEDFDTLDDCTAWLLGTDCEEEEQLSEMDADQFMDWVREHFDVSGPTQRMMENALDYAKGLPEEEQYPALSVLLSGAIGLTDDEIRKIKL